MLIKKRFNTFSKEEIVFFSSLNYHHEVKTHCSDCIHSAIYTAFVMRMCNFKHKGNESAIAKSNQ